MNYWSFLARFVLWSVALFLAWHVYLAHWYVALMAAAGPVVTAGLTGFTAEIQGSGREARVFFPYQGGTIGIHLATLFDGLLPFLALVAATSARSIADRAKIAAAGFAVFLVFHLAMFVAYPFFLSRSGLVVSSLGAFWAILTLVGFPFLLWLLLLRAIRPSRG